MTDIPLAVLPVQDRLPHTTRNAVMSRLAAEPREPADATNRHMIRPAEHPMDAILATTSHELTAPLTVLAGSLQLAERWILEAADDVTPDQRQRMDDLTRLLCLANQQVGRMSRLVTDLRDSVSIHAGELQMCFEPADLVNLVVGVVAEQRLLHPRRAFHLALPQYQPVIATIDAQRIEQVLTNYLINAVKYTPAERSIEIRLQVRDTTARVAVRDHGPGLAPHECKRIWERFQQARTLGVDGEASGLGLGLHISRTIVEQHRGCVGVESVLGEGATFWFDIPLERAAPLSVTSAYDGEVHFAQVRERSASATRPSTLS